MHFAEGGTLQKLISDQQGKYLPEKLVLYYFAQLAQALRFIHSKKILHRDLKTQNILLNRKRTMVMLGDFGISKELNTGGVASTLIGTPNYLSPEICEGKSLVKGQKTTCDFRSKVQQQK
jgi:NIMA (never in mitosis gene a)-related kinase